MPEAAFNPIKHDRAFEAIVRQIESAILDGVYQVGDYLPSERALVEQFQVGRSSVREALRILESLGMVRTSPGNRKGVEVTDSMASSMSRLLNGALRIRSIPLVDLVEYRMMIGSTGNFLAAHSRSEEHLVLMRQAVTDMEAVRNEPEAFALADVAFHSAIQDASGNSLMRMVNSVIESAVIDLLHTAIGEESDDAPAMRDLFIGKHRDLLAAIEEGRGHDAAALARDSLLEAYGPRLTDEERRRLELLAGTRLEDFSQLPLPAAATPL